MAKELWAWQGGTVFDDYLRAAGAGPNGSVVLAGYTWGAWEGTETGNPDAAAVKLDADGSVRWRWQGSNDTYAHASGAAVGQDGTAVLACTGSGGLVAVKLDLEGSLLWTWQGGVPKTDVANAVTMGVDGSVVLAGRTLGDWGVHNRGSTDFAAVKLDVDGKLVWKWQEGTADFDQLWAAAMGEDGSFVLAGESSGSWSGGKKGDFDFVAVKLDADGKELWRWQDGTANADTFQGAAVGADGSVVLAGYTSGDWGGANAGVLDFAAVKLDADGKELWRWQGGTAQYSVLYGAAVAGDGSVILAGHTDGSWSGSSAGAKDFAAVKLGVDGKEDWRWQGGSADNDYLSDIVVTTDGRVVLAGTTFGSHSGANLGKADFTAAKLDAAIATNTDAHGSSSSSSSGSSSRGTAGVGGVAGGRKGQENGLQTHDNTRGTATMLTGGLVQVASGVLITAAACLLRRRRGGTCSTSSRSSSSSSSSKHKKVVVASPRVAPSAVVEDIESVQ